MHHLCPWETVWHGGKPLNCVSSVTHKRVMITAVDVGVGSVNCERQAGSPFQNQFLSGREELDKDGHVVTFPGFSRSSITVCKPGVVLHSFERSCFVAHTGLELRLVPAPNLPSSYISVSRVLGFWCHHALLAKIILLRMMQLW